LIGEDDIAHFLGNPNMKKTLEGNPDKAEAIKQDFKEAVH